jgi:exopolyphosphatase/guanosine-5'-triphosphate,3'-diphosphate pyrophosphatase
LAALDVGSNTIHITAARVIKQCTELVRLADETDLVRLGIDVHTLGLIGPERMERAIATIHKQVALAHAVGAKTVLALATHAIREATNGGELMERVRRDVGVHIEAISGAQEAALTYWGAVSGLKRNKHPRAVIDMGGGSLELAIGTDLDIAWRASLPLGSGAIRELIAFADPPRRTQLAAARHYVTDHLRDLPVPARARQAIVCGGTAGALATLANHIVLPGDACSDWPQVSASASASVSAPAQAPLRRKWLSREHLEAALPVLTVTSAAQIAARVDVDEGRARLLPAGAVVLSAVMEWLGVEEVRVRRRGIREGAMLTYACVGNRWLDVAAGALPH